MKSSRLLIYLALFWAFTILVLGGWWLYLIFSYGKYIADLALNDPILKSKTSLILWEGGTFFVLIILLTVTLFLLFLKDQKKTRSLQAFFASLTHELKTPLASVRLQSEVINEHVKVKNDEKLNQLTDRLIEDTQKLEDEMDKILQLSRIERGGNLNPTSLNLTNFLDSKTKEWKNKLNINIDNKCDYPYALFDQFALNLILRNLLDNTLTHSPNKNVDITIEESDQVISLLYTDHGKFEGETEKLGELFYKFKSSKGSGIGLYLSKKLMDKMQGRFEIINSPELAFLLSFPKSMQEEI